MHPLVKIQILKLIKIQKVYKHFIRRIKQVGEKLWYKFEQKETDIHCAFGRYTVISVKVFLAHERNQIMIITNKIRNNFIERY